MFICVGADNLAANFSRELADYIIYIIDVSGGDKIPRKGGPGITQADLLVCNFYFFIPSAVVKVVVTAVITFKWFNILLFLYCR